MKLHHLLDLSMRARKYNDAEKNEAIQLLLDGNTPDEVSKLTGIPSNTIISWRTKHKQEFAVSFPNHRLGKKRPESAYAHFKNQAFKYSDEEIISLARINQGYGIAGFVKKLYPSKRVKSKTRLKYRFVQMFRELHEETGEDLYSHLQDPDFIVMVTEYEYRRITGRKQVPKGYGRNTGGRVNNKTRNINKGAPQVRVPLHPQIFNWGDQRRPDERDWRYVEELYNSNASLNESFVEDLPNVDSLNLESLALFKNPWNDAVKLFQLFKQGDLDLSDPGPSLFLPAAKAVEWFWRAIFLPTTNFKERHFNVNRAKGVVKSVIRGDINAGNAKYTSGLEPNPVVIASGDIWNQFSERIIQPEMKENWKKIEKATPRIFHRAGEYRHCTMKPFAEIIEEFEYVSQHMNSFISAIHSLFPELANTDRI